MLERRSSVRQCVVCKKRDQREFFFRILQEHKTKEYILSPSKKQHGRSIYFCKTANCLEAMKRHKRYKDSLGTLLGKISLS